MPKNLLETLRRDCPTTALVRIWGYGYLDQILTEYSEGRINEVELRRDHYLLKIAVEGRLQEMEKAERNEALRQLMIRRQEALEAEGARITKR